MSRTLPQILSLKQVRAVFTLADERNIKTAAQTLNTSQPALSRTIKGIEALIGVPLFQRSWYGTDPTVQGEVVVEHCQRVLTALELFERSELGNHDGHLRLPVYLRWRHLEAMAAVIRVGTAKAAASDLGISQPAISRSIGEVTELAGSQLFKRHVHGLAPTPLAYAFVGLWDGIFKELRGMPSQLERVKHGLVGRVSVGLLPFSDQDLVVRAFAELTQHQPNLRLYAAPGSYNSLVEALAQGEFDLVIGLLRQPSPNAQLEEHALYLERFTLIARHDHPCHELDLTLDHLAKFQWMLAPYGTPTRQCFETLFAATGKYPPGQTFQIMSFSMSEEMIANSQAIGLLNYSNAALDRLRPDLKPLAFSLPDPIRPVGITMRRGEAVRPPVKHFLDALTRQIEARGLR